MIETDIEIMIGIEIVVEMRETKDIAAEVGKESRGDIDQDHQGAKAKKSEEYFFLLNAINTIGILSLFFAQ